MLQAECELREKSLISCWNSYGIPLEAAISQLRGQVRGLLNETEIPTGYKAWAQVHFDIHDQLRVNTSNLCFRCSEKSCIHYIYGFSTIDELRKHFGERHRPISSAPPIINQEDRLLQNQTPITCQDILNDSDLNADFVYVSFDSSSVQKRKAQKQPAGRRKDKRRSGDEVTKTGRQKDPCLRCKVLKKEV